MNPYSNEKWAVVIHGQGDIHAAPSFEAACAAAEGFNTYITGEVQPTATEYHPKVWATVARWGDVSKGDHLVDESVFTDEFGLTLRQRQQRLNDLSADLLEFHGIDQAAKTLAGLLMILASKAGVDGLTASRDGLVVTVKAVPEGQRA